MQRTIDDYDSMTKREIIKAKQEKGQMYNRFIWYNNNKLTSSDQASPEI